jgi:hypothetical protein
MMEYWNGGMMEKERFDSTSWHPVSSFQFQYSSIPAFHYSSKKTACLAGFSTRKASGIWPDISAGLRRG